MLWFFPCLYRCTTFHLGRKKESTEVLEPKVFMTFLLHRACMTSHHHHRR